MEQESDPLGNRTELEHNALGELQALRDAVGNTTRFEHDAAGRLIAQTGSDGRRSEYTLNAQGWPVQVLEHAGLASSGKADHAHATAHKTAALRTTLWAGLLLGYAAKARRLAARRRHLARPAVRLH